MRRAVVVLAVLLTAACGRPAGPPSARSTPEPSVSAAPEVPGIEVELVRQRTDEAIGGQVQVRVTDTGDTPFTVTSVALRTPGFAPLPPIPVTAEYAPGRVIDLPVHFGDVVCDAAPLPATADLTVRRPDGSVEQVAVPAAADVMGLIHREECAVRAVLAVVDIAVTDLHDDGDTLAGTLTLTRRSGREPVTATRLIRSVLIEPTARLPLKMDAGRASASTSIVFTPASCDPHVIAETKKPYVFPLAVTVGEKGDGVPVDLPLGQAARDQLAGLVQRVCAPS